MFEFLKHPLYRFLVTFLLLFIAWFVLYELWLHPEGSTDQALVNITLSFSEWVLRVFGYDAFVYGREIHISGSSGLWMGDNCNALPLFAMFAGFVIAFPGNIRKKLLFILFGIVTIFLLNCIRIIALTIIDTYSRSWTEFNHSYTFNIIIYGYIFLLWMWWAKRLSGKSLTPTGNSNAETA